MSKFDKLYTKSHVKNHPWFQDMEDRIVGMRQALQKKSDAEFSLHDVFNEKRQVGLKPGDRTLNAYIQEAAITAREALNSFDFPIRPQISYNNSRQVKFAAHDPSQVVEAEILFNVKIATVSGVLKTATLPLKVVSGMVVPPSVLVYDGRMKTLGQAAVDEIVQRHTSYSLQPMRGMFSPPMTSKELETAVATKNEVGYQPRELTMEGRGVRRTNRKRSEMDPEVARWYKMYQAAGNSPEEAIEMAKEQAAKMNTKNSRNMRTRRMAEDVTKVENPNAPKKDPKSDVNPWAETGLWNFTQPGLGDYHPGDPIAPGSGEPQSDAVSPPEISPEDTAFIYGEILANRDIMRMVVDAINPSVDEVSERLFEILQPFAESLHLNALAIDYFSLAEDLQKYLQSEGQEAGGSITKAVARRVAFITAEYMILRRRFGYRMAAASAKDNLQQWRQMLQKSEEGGNISPQDAAFVQQHLDQAEQVLSGGDEASAVQLMEAVRPYFDAGGVSLGDEDLAEGGVFQQSEFQDPATFLQDEPATFSQDPQTFLQDAPQAVGQDPGTFFQSGGDIPKKLWRSFMARMERQGRLVKVAGGTPIGYLEVVEAMLEAEEAGLDTFPRPFIHVARNYIMAHSNTASQNQWMPHLINDGFVINPLGMNRGRMRRLSSREKVALAPDLKKKVDVLYQRYLNAADETQADRILDKIFSLGEEAADYFNSKTDMDLQDEGPLDVADLKYANKKVAISPKEKALVEKLYDQWLELPEGDDDANDAIYQQLDQMGEAAQYYWENLITSDEVGDWAGGIEMTDEEWDEYAPELGAKPKVDRPDVYEPKNKVKWAKSRNPRQE